MNDMNLDSSLLCLDTLLQAAEEALSSGGGVIAVLRAGLAFRAHIDAE